MLSSCPEMQYWQFEHSTRKQKIQSQVYRLIRSRDLSPSAAPSTQENPSCWTQGSWRSHAITAAISGVLQHSVLLWSDPCSHKGKEEASQSHVLHLKDTLKDRPVVLSARVSCAC